MSKTRNSDVPLTGIAIGAVVLALFVVFAVLLPKAEGDDANGRVDLPASLPGGLVSADTASAWKGVSNVAGHEAEVAAEVKAEIKYGNAQLQKTTGGGFGHRIYIKDGGKQFYFVQVFRAAGGAFAPGEISDPSQLQQGSSVQQLSKVGKAVCITDGQVGTGGQVQASEVQCQRSEGDLTVQVMSPGAAASDVTKVADLVLSKVN